MIYYKNSSELYHHGVDGQKWGQRHGPPYPLDTKAKRAAGYISRRKVKRIERKDEKLRKQKIAAAKAQKEKEEQIAKKKEQLMKKPNANEIYENRYIFTEDELRSLYNQLKLYDDVKKLKVPEKTTYDKVKKASQIAGEAEKGMTATLKTLKGGAKLYNDFVDIGGDLGWWEKEVPKIDLKNLGPTKDEKDKKK